MSEKKMMNKIQPSINSVTHKYNGNISWEDAIEKVIISYLKEAKRLD